MRRTPRAVYLWPGLPQLSQRGSWAALLVAVAAAVLLNVTLLGSFVWPDWLARELRIICWTFLAVGWCVAAGCSAWWNHRQEVRRSDPTEDTFGQALDSYLKGNWVQAERELDGLLRRDNQDVEARLMLATLLRHTRRYEEATRQLNHLVRMEGARPWAWEIHREGELLADARKRTITAASLEKANDGDH